MSRGKWFVVLFALFFAIQGASASSFNSSAPNVSNATGTLPVLHGGTGLTTLGTGLQQIRVNAGATALEYFTPSAGAASQLTSTTSNTITLGSDLVGLSLKGFSGGGANILEVHRPSDNYLGFSISNDSLTTSMYQAAVATNFSVGNLLTAPRILQVLNTNVVGDTITGSNGQSADMLDINSFGNTGGDLFSVNFNGQITSKGLLVLSDGMYNIGMEGTGFLGMYAKQFNASAPGVVHNGSTSGVLYFATPMNGDTLKVIVLQLAAFKDSGHTYNFPTAFGSTPVLVGNNTGVTPTFNVNGVNVGDTHVAGATGTMIFMGY
jgi:hypothetical protein